MIWAVDQDSTLTAGWLAGLPSSQIAALVGVSASAVRGRARDLNLPMRAEQMVWAGKFKGQPPPIRTSKPLPPLGQLGPESRPKPWADRDFGDCTFPVGEGDQGLVACCGPILRGARRPYCRFHLDLTKEAARVDERAA